MILFALIVVCLLLFWAIILLFKSKRNGDVYFYLDKKGEGHIKWFPKGTAVDGVKLSEDDLRELKESGKLDISNRKNFKAK